MKVLKFGGTSVKNAENISKVIEIVRGDISQHEVLVVVSAFGGITNLLIETAQKAAKGDESYKVLFNQISDAHAQVIEQLLSGDLRTQCESYIVEQLSNFKDILHGLYLLRELSTRSLDLVSSFGERLSAYIIAHAFTAKGIPARYLDAREVIKTDKTFGAAKVNFEKTNRLIAQKVKNSNTLWIATGFIASTDDDETITLGRGGSDYSGAIFARALETNILEIWTDVDGMMTADPRKVKKAYPISNITYSEAMELSHFGAKVLEPRTVIPAMAIGIPVLIKNTFNPTAPGTLITAQNEQSAHRVQGISSIDDISLITVQGSGMAQEKTRFLCGQVADHVALDDEKRFIAQVVIKVELIGEGAIHIEQSSDEAMAFLFIHLFKEFFSQSAFAGGDLEKFLVVEGNVEAGGKVLSDFVPSATQLPSDGDGEIPCHGVLCC